MLIHFAGRITRPIGCVLGHVAADEGLNTGAKGLTFPGEISLVGEASGSTDVLSGAVDYLRSAPTCDGRGCHVPWSVSSLLIACLTVIYVHDRHTLFRLSTRVGLGRRRLPCPRAR